MNAWVLVLALYAGGTGSAGKSLAVVTGYASELNCNNAATAALNQMSRTYHAVDAAFCIPGPTK